MTTLKCTFKSCGEIVTVTAILYDDLAALSNSKKNQANDIIGEEWNDGETWSLLFEDVDADYELHFKMKDRERTLEPVRAVTWAGEGREVVDDSQFFSVKISHK